MRDKNSRIRGDNLSEIALQTHRLLWGPWKIIQMKWLCELESAGQMLISMRFFRGGLIGTGMKTAENSNIC
jgi:hypothetical protein